MTKHFNPTISKLIIGGAEYEYEVRYINNRAVAIGYRADLSGADLTRANLRGANVTDANLRDANLILADLAGANLIDAYLRDANLADANLAGAELTRAYLTDANLRGAKNLDSAYGLSTVTGKPASLPEGWEYTEGKGIHKAAPQDPEPTCAHVQHGKFCSDCGEEV